MQNTVSIQGSFAKETYHFKEPSIRSHPIRDLNTGHLSMYTQIHSDHSYYFDFDNIDYSDYFDQVICVCTHVCIDMCETCSPKRGHFSAILAGFSYNIIECI